MRVLYIDCDTLRPDHLASYGYPRVTAPNIDRIAREGVRFTNCYTSDAPCQPSRTALLSGRFGIHNGVVGHAGTAHQMRYPGDAHQTDPEAAPLPLVLSQGGTPTITFSTFHQRHLAWSYTSGWDEVHRFTQDIGREIATDLEGPAMRWLADNGEREDWYLHLHFWDPHTPYHTPQEYGDPFADEPPPPWPTPEVVSEQLESGWGPLCARDFLTWFGGNEEFPRHPASIDRYEDIRHWLDGYHTGIRYMDDVIGRILDQLDELGILDDTAIIVSADHGENQGELDRYGSHTTADAITNRVPLIIRWPGMAADAVCDTPIYQLDLAPTLCELLGVEAPSRWDGRPFTAALRGEEIDARPYLVFGQGVWAVQRSVLQDGMLYIRTLHPALDPLPPELLFDLRSDPHEEHDLVEERPDDAARLARSMLDWWHDHAPRSGEDPLLTICREGGPYYPRLARDPYLQRLRDTDRTHIAEQLERQLERHPVPPVRDPYDLRRY